MRPASATRKRLLAQVDLRTGACSRRYLDVDDLLKHVAAADSRNKRVKQEEAMPANSIVHQPLPMSPLECTCQGFTTVSGFVGLVDITSTMGPRYGRLPYRRGRKWSKQKETPRNPASATDDLRILLRTEEAACASRIHSTPQPRTTIEDSQRDKRMPAEAL
jgi:hypothetical protein